jgi:hypothetical protein
MPSKIADVHLSLHITSNQLQVLTDTLELEVQRTVDSEGFCGSEVDERENLAFRCDLLSVLLQIATRQPLLRGGVVNA